MAFIDIQDPVKREQTVQDYIENLQEIRQRKENQKVRGITEQRNIKKYSSQLFKLQKNQHRKLPVK